MLDRIDERDKQERMHRSIVKYWNVNYIPTPYAEPKEEQTGEKEDAVTGQQLPVEPELTVSSANYGNEEVTDEVTKGQIDKILHEKTEAIGQQFPSTMEAIKNWAVNLAAGYPDIVDRIMEIDIAWDKVSESAINLIKNGSGSLLSSTFNFATSVVCIKLINCVEILLLNTRFRLLFCIRIVFFIGFRKALIDIIDHFFLCLFRQLGCPFFKLFLQFLFCLLADIFAVFV